MHKVLNKNLGWDSSLLSGTSNLYQVAVHLQSWSQTFWSSCWMSGTPLPEQRLLNPFEMPLGIPSSPLAAAPEGRRCLSSCATPASLVEMFQTALLAHVWVILHLHSRSSCVCCPYRSCHGTSLTNLLLSHCTAVSIPTWPVNALWG